VDFVRCQDECHFVDLVAATEKLSCRLDGNSRRLRNRIAIGTATDRWKCRSLDRVLDREAQGVPITFRQSFCFAVFSSAPKRADGVNDKARPQAITTRQFRFARFTTAEATAFRQQLGPGGAMDCTIDSATAEQRRVRGVYDGIDIERGDVATNDGDLRDPCFQFMEQAGRSTRNRRPAACNESDRASDPDGPARIRFGRG